MSAQPIIVRELLVASRRRGTWMLRLAFAAGIGAAFAFGLFLPEIPTRQRGQAVLGCVAIAGFVLSLAAGPYLTADALSSERREGTLGLLFLTPLNGVQIVLGKMATHSIQVVYALFGTFPFLFLPVLIGGVLWSEVLRIILVLLITLLLSLGAGILWSAVGEDARGTAMGCILSLLLLTFLPWLLPLADLLAHGPGINFVGIPQLSPLTLLTFAFESSFASRSSAGPGPMTGRTLFWNTTLLHATLALALVWLAGHLLPHCWRRSPSPPADPPGPPIPRDTAHGQTPASSRAGIRASEAALNRAPLVWLASRRGGDPRLMVAVRWILVLFFAVMLAVSVTTSQWQAGFSAAFFSAYAIHLVARVHGAWTATRWLERERRSGALELILTTTVTDAEILGAHHESLRIAFRRPLLTLLGLNAALELAVLACWDHLHMDHGAGKAFTTLFVGGALVTLADFAALRWIGLREALRQPTPARAAGRAFANLVAGPWIALALAIAVLPNGGQEQAVWVFSAWFAFGLGWDAFMVARCRRFIQARPRLRIAED